MSQRSSHLSDHAFAFISLGGVIAAGVVGFWLIGSPVKQRLILLDKERVNDLSHISSQLWQQTARVNDGSFEPLPTALPVTSLRKEIYTDPETGRPYEYYRLSDTTYELCANFALASTDRESKRYYDDRHSPNWEHPAGRYCYQLDIGQESPPIPIK